MGILDFFRRRKKEVSGICFSKGKTREELLKLFFETYSDEIDTVIQDGGAKITEKTEQFLAELKDGRKITVWVNSGRDFILKKKTAVEMFLEKTKFSKEHRDLSEIDEKELSGYNSLLITMEAMNREERKDENIMKESLMNFIEKFYKLSLVKDLRHYHYSVKRLVQDDSKWEISDFIPPLSKKMFSEYDIEMSINDMERMKKSIEKIKKDGFPYDEKMEVSVLEKDVKIRQKWEIIRKIIAITMTRLAAETHLEKKEGGEKELAEIIRIFEERYQFKQVLSEREKNFIENPKATADLNAEFYFMLESAKMLLWVLSVLDIEFNDFNTFSDVSVIINGLKNENLRSFARKCEIRSVNKIMDMLDYTYRLNWANVEIKLEGYERIVNESIMYFSRLALEWVVQDGKSMDDIIIHT